MTQETPDVPCLRRVLQWTLIGKAT